jgi:glycerophosphoryl diester phosphodiesterase
MAGEPAFSVKLANVPTLRRVGHKGADLIEPGNTPASFEAALTHGVDMIELDVLPDRRTDRLILAHDYDDAARRTPVSLDEGLSYLASEPFAAIDLIVDLKLPGYEREVIAALERSGLKGRALVSTQYRASLDVLRAIDGDLRLGWSVPRARRDYLRSRLFAAPAIAALRALRLALPRLARAALQSGRCDALVAHWRLVTPRLVQAVTGSGGELYVWTVDDAVRIRALEALGVTGVITNDPRLFGPTATPV